VVLANGFAGLGKTLFDDFGGYFELVRFVPIAYFRRFLKLGLVAPGRPLPFYVILYSLIIFI